MCVLCVGVCVCCVCVCYCVELSCSLQALFEKPFQLSAFVGVFMMNVHYCCLYFWCFIFIPGVQLRIVYGHSRSVLSMEIGELCALLVCPCHVCCSVLRFTCFFPKCVLLVEPLTQHSVLFVRRICRFSSVCCVHTLSA